MHDEQPMRLLVVEDERKVASFIAQALREQRYQVDIAETGEKALVMARAAVYQAILLDIRLPGLDGIQTCRELRRMGLETPILMLTARGLVEERVAGLDSGADDYLAKPFALAELHARVRALTRRGMHNRSAILCFRDIEIDRHRRRASRAGIQLSLTPKELCLLELLVERAPEPVTRAEVIESVWSYGFDTETNLVEVYVNRLRQKVDLPGQEKRIHTVRGVGYRVGGPE
jgi:DNA-binding response OmpR family regulator